MNEPIASKLPEDTPESYRRPLPVPIMITEEEYLVCNEIFKELGRSDGVHPLLLTLTHKYRLDVLADLIRNIVDQVDFYKVENGYEL